MLRTRFFIVFGMLLVSQLVYANTMVIYPQTGANVPAGPVQPGATSVLQPISRTQQNPWYAYFVNLKNCQPGVYSLPQIDPDLINTYGNLTIYEIKGQKDGKCNVVISNGYTQMNQSPSVTLWKECSFSDATIDLLIARYTNFINNKAGGADTDEQAYNDNMARECH